MHITDLTLAARRQVLSSAIVEGAGGDESGSFAASASITREAVSERVKTGIESTEPLRITSVPEVR